MKKFIIPLIVFFVLTISGIIWIQAASPTVGTPTANPTQIAVGTSTTVTITSIIADSSVIPTGVNLLRLNATGNPTVLGRLRDDGTGGDTIAGDKIFTAIIIFQETTAGPIRLQVSAAFKGLLRRVSSETTTIFAVVSQNIGFIIPPLFQVNSQVINQGGPIALNTFASQYQPGGVIPPGGAEIDILKIPLPSDTLSTYVEQETQGSMVIGEGTLVVSGATCKQVFYSDIYSPTLTYKNVAVYCPSGTWLYKLFMSYRSGDPKEDQFLASFQQLLNSTEFMP